MPDLAAARRSVDAALDALESAVRSLGEVRDRLAEARDALATPVREPEPRPQPQPARLVVGAMVVNASSCSPDLLRQAGLTHVAVELTSANAADFATSRWDGFAKGWFVVSRGDDSTSLTALLQQSAVGVSFAVVDTESHKVDAGGSLAWTENLFGRLRDALGPAFELYNVTFGVHSSPEVVNHHAFRAHHVTPIWEAYDGEGRTLGVTATAEKARREGWGAPHLAIGDKSIAADADELAGGAVAGLGGVWVWAPEQSGADVLRLASLRA